MALRVTFSLPALADLDSIVAYISIDNPQAAERVYVELRGRCLALADTPLIGASPLPGVRRIVVGNYLIFYRPRSDRVQIARIIHGARLIPPSLGG